ncbi:MAG TPA: HoxN/HupN/NixA family nickel/cobalt transporter [Acidimicrobiales bacterium]|nr:HoxN/HupN/NixA family nickel/cobalt transporter [Acidimicrobiales bacterium]
MALTETTLRLLNPRRWRLTRQERFRLAGMTAAVITLNVVGWSLLALALSAHLHVSQTKAFGLGTGVLAYTLGMRHAFDADHIAAIDNTTRKLVGDGKRPLGVGFSFSLGHSSVVLVLALALNFGIHALNLQVSEQSSGFHAVTSIIGTSISGTFLYLLALINLFVLVSIFRLYRQMGSGRYDAAELERQLQKRGLMNRVLGRYSQRIDSSWKMYPVGVLFGLGFDTATEVALLVLAGATVAGGLPAYAIFSLPILFAAGMCLFDTLDGCFMNFAYDWAFANPVRKVFYNLTITGLSVAVAFFVGTIEILGLIAQEADLNSPLWNFFRGFNINTAGYVIVGVFVVTWVAALAYWRLARVEERMVLEPALDRADVAEASEPFIDHVQEVATG